MSSQTKEHLNLRPKPNSATQAESAETPAADSPRLEEIRIRAYEIYIERGGEPGYDLDDWLQAERELETRVRRANAGQ
jgi:hypothetical protein